MLALLQLQVSLRKENNLPPYERFISLILTSNNEKKLEIESQKLKKNLLEGRVKNVLKRTNTKFIGKIRLKKGNENAVRSVLLTDEEKKLIKPLGLLTEKPIIYATNLGEDELAKGNSFSEEVNKLATKEGSECVKISAQVEAELIELGEEEKIL